MAQTHYSAFTVQAAQVPSTQTNFPVLLNPTDNRFKTTAAAPGVGHVASSSGFDLRPYSDTGLTTPITTYQLVTYDGTAGTFEMWVSVASLAVGSVVYIGYGDTTLTSDGSSNTTWDANFTGVWHLKDGTTLAVTDSSQSAHNGTNDGATATAGKIDGAAAFVTGSAQTVILPAADALGNLAAYQLALWIKTANTADAGNFYGEGNSGVTAPIVRVNINDSGAGRINFMHRADDNVTGSVTSASNYSDNAWHYVVAVRHASQSFELFVDNSSVGTETTNAPGTTTIDVSRLGALERNTIIHYLTGALDEIQRSKIARSADWNTTAYNNQSAPGTFYAIGTEVATGGGGGGGKPAGYYAMMRGA